MHAVRSLRARTPAALALAAAALAALILAAAMAAAPAASAAAGSGSCHESYQPPRGWVVVCTDGSGSGGSGGSGGGSGGTYTCTLTPLSPGQIKFLGLPKPPKGKKWAAVTCPGKDPFGGVTLMGAGGKPAVTPQELMETAWRELRVPALKVSTAPPRGAAGLVGLPEWYWIQGGSWKPVRVTVAAGPVWATVTARPVDLAFDPGGGLPAASCQGPGTPYTATAASQSACTYTYDQSSATQPGRRYAAAVTVTWQVSWTGSGGTGGMLNPALPVADDFSLRVAEGQALVTGTGVGQ